MRVLRTLGQAFTSSPIGMGLLDMDGCWLEVNPALCRMLVRRPEELLGRPVSEITHPDDRAAGAGRMAEVAAGSVPEQVFEERCIRGDGSVAWVRVTITVTLDDDDRPEAVVGQIEDITGRREAERRFRAAFDDAPIAMVLSSARQEDAGRPLRINQAMCTMLGWEPEEILDQPSLAFFAEGHRAEVAADYGRLIAGEVPRLAAERLMRRRDGSTVWVALSASLVPEEPGSAGYVIAQFVDIDDRKRSERLLREAEARFRTAFEDAAMPMVLWDTDLLVYSANAAMAAMLGTTEDALIGRQVVSLVDAADRERIGGDLVALAEGTVDRCERQVRWLRDDGGEVLAVMRAALLRDDDGQPSYGVGQLQDVSAEREATRVAQLRLAQQTAVAWLGQRALAEDDLGALFQAATDVVAETCETPYTALAMCEGDALRLVAHVGWSVGSPRMALDPRGSQAAYTLHTGLPVIVDDVAVEHRFDSSMLVRHDACSGMSVTVAGESGVPTGVLSVHSTEPRAFTTDDIAFLSSIANVLTGAIRRAAAARDLRHRSLHDPLTQLPNRALMLDRLRQGIARSRRDGSTLAVLFCDMDDFKYVNDTLGHDAGDRLLSELAIRLRGALRTPDTLARFGGDEFVMLCEGLTDAAEVTAVADRVLAACARPIDLGGAEFVSTASIGIALAHGASGTDPEALLRDADVAMYRAKTRGKGRYELFDATMRQQTVERVALLGDLRRAVAREELRLVFQPIVSLRHRSLASVEALVRWQHPDRGLLAPDQFIDIAQDSGLIDEIGAWVIDEGVRQTAEWQRRGTPGLSDIMCAVNVSWRQLSSGALIQTVTEALERHGLDPVYFCAEVTESAVLEDEERAGEALRALRELGMQLALDDFGTGQSSLAVLRNFPFNALKLDRSFAAAGDWDIVRAVTQMARSLDLDVIAEGIERCDQERAATSLGCDFGQGWLYGRAVAGAQLEELIVPLTTQITAGGRG